MGLGTEADVVLISLWLSGTIKEGEGETGRSHQVVARSSIDPIVDPVLC